MKIQTHTVTSTQVDQTGDRISENEILKLYKQTPIPCFVKKNHDIIAPPIARLVSKSIGIGVCGYTMTDGKLIPTPGSNFIIARSGNVPDCKEFTEEEILDTYQRLHLPPLPDSSRVFGEPPRTMSKILAILGEFEILDEEKITDMRGVSIGFTKGAYLKTFCFPGSDDGKKAGSGQGVRAVTPIEPHITINASPELFDIKQIKQVLKFSRLDFVIEVNLLHQKALKDFPWIIAFAFVSSQYFSGFLGELGRNHADGLSGWLEQLIASHKSKADEEIRFQFVMPLEIGDPSFSLQIAVGSGKISEFSRAYDEQKIIGEIERQSSHKVADIQEVSVSYLGGDTYRLEYAITRSGELIKSLE